MQIKDKKIEKKVISFLREIQYTEKDLEKALSKENKKYFLIYWAIVCNSSVQIQNEFFKRIKTESSLVNLYKNATFKDDFAKNFDEFAEGLDDDEDGEFLSNKKFISLIYNFISTEICDGKPMQESFATMMEARKSATQIKRDNLEKEKQNKRKEDLWKKNSDSHKEIVKKFQKEVESKFGVKVRPNKDFSKLSLEVTYGNNYDEKKSQESEKKCKDLLEKITKFLDEKFPYLEGSFRGPFVMSDDEKGYEGFIDISVKMSATKDFEDFKGSKNNPSHIISYKVSRGDKDIIKESENISDISEEVKMIMSERPSLIIKVGRLKKLKKFHKTSQFKNVIHKKNLRQLKTAAGIALKRKKKRYMKKYTKKYGKIMALRNKKYKNIKD